ncbi:TonB-dependent siderophore receptor [Aquincola tertiaricarbonis]|uniref:TonB-dependent siderophore receptor n=1 Tax=Aquincola tertiaricarbonis TaxID=391953 RepID=A0ABY4SCA1_AQUTE|nr:TonB-dependent siderophore receptor [Aquincola tertiaricarbonis]URI10225.1 TonB-dependent siderophore receptor [Aquincola tertiaricarbonis]
MTRPRFRAHPGAHLGARRTTLACAATSTLLFGALPAAWAQTPAATPEAPVTQVLITGNADRQTATGPVKGYNARRSATATKTDTPLSETAQSVTVITRDQLVDQAATNLQDALNYAAGVRSDAYGLDSRSDGFRIRGGNADEYLDGLRKNFDYYTSNTRTDPYTLERIDVLRGPAAMLFGQGSTGGVVNMVSKRPQDVAQGEVGLQIGSFNRRQVQADLTGPLTADGQWLYRLVAVARDADTQVDHVRDDRGLLAPTLTWRPSNVTSLTLQGLVQNDKSGSTSQFFPWSGVVTANPNGKLPTSRFIGNPDWDRYDSQRRTLGWLFEHRFDNGWQLNQGLRYSRNTVDYRTTYGDSFSVPGDWAADPTGKRLLGRYASASYTQTRLLTLDQNLQGRVNTGAVQHDLLVGLDYARYRKTGTSGFAGSDPDQVPLIDAYNPVYTPFTPPESFAIDPSTQRQLGVYLQDQIRFGEHWLITAGLRHDQARNHTDGQDDQDSSATTKRLGAMYNIAGGWSPYLSYSESFTPVANIGNQRFKPLRGKQWEAGVKHESADGRLIVNAAVYDLREKNQLVSDPSTNLSRQVGETKATGVELEVKAALRKDFDLVASYTYTNVDEPLEEVPHDQAAVWGKWRFMVAGQPGFSAGAGVRYKSSFHDGAAPTVPSVTLLDAMLAWENTHWRAALNISNLTDKTYVATCLGRGDCWFGARRNAVASLTYRW